MHPDRAVIIFAIAVLFALTSPVFSQVTPLTTQSPAPVAQSVAVNETPELWFVELASPPAVEGTSPSQLKREKDLFRAEAARAGLRFQERYAFDTLFNGISLRISPASVSALARINGVKAIYPVDLYSLDPVERGSGANLVTALAMTGADIVHSELGYTGAGVKVGVIDTGVDIDHPDLGGAGVNGATPFPTSRVIKGWDFVGDAFTGSNTPVPDAIPDDCGGHGTHVAGIVGANGAVRGVAPNALLGAYRVFGCTGTTTADIMIAAMEKAYQDGMQIVNMSIGASYQWPQYPTAAAATRLVNKGVVVVCSIGNSGANGLYAASAPGVGSKVIGVASFVNNYTNLTAFTVSPDGLAVGYTRLSGAPIAPFSGSAPMARTGTATSVADACAALPPGSLTGMIALIRRGTCSFYQKSMNAQNAGAVGVVIYNNTAGIPSFTAAGTPAVAIPVVAIQQADGIVLDARIAAGPTTLTWTAGSAAVANSNGNLIASTSSYGLAPDLSFKPDIGAPGGLVRSTVPIELGSYDIYSGTSMASPHVAGAAALLLQARPHTPSQAMGRILQNYASPRIWFGNPALGLIETAHRQGAGMLQIDKAILGTTQVEPGSLALGEVAGSPVTRTITIHNNSGSSRTYGLASLPAVATGPNTYTVSFFAAPSTVGFSQFGVPVTQVVVPPGSYAFVDVAIAPNSGLPDRSLFGGYVVVTPNVGEALTVPYAGFKGDYQGFPVLVPTGAGLPWLARASGSTFVRQDAGAVFTMQGNAVPFILLHLDHQVRRLRVEYFDANSGRAWHRAFPDIEYLGRNSTAASFFALACDGVSVFGNQQRTLPEGTYVVKLSILKALGDDSNPAHWETWTSPAFVIDRP